MLQATVSYPRRAVVVAPVAAIVLGRKDEVGQPQIGEGEVERQQVTAIALESWSENGEEVEKEGYHGLYVISITFRHAHHMRNEPGKDDSFTRGGEQGTRENGILTITSSKMTCVPRSWYLRMK